MKVLIACEYSGRVRDAFTALGHDAMSCDLLPTDSAGRHYQGDVFDLDLSQFDLMIAQPPCTYLSASGMHWTTRGLRDAKLTEDSMEFVEKLLNCGIPRIALENPIGIISSRVRKPEQIIQPYQFGDDASKKTCLWLKNLPTLAQSNEVAPRVVELPNGKIVKRWANQTDSGQNVLGPSEDRWKLRSITYQGIANAMASQWGAL